MDSEEKQNTPYDQIYKRFFGEPAMVQSLVSGLVSEETYAMLLKNATHLGDRYREEGLAKGRAEGISIGEARGEARGISIGKVEGIVKYFIKNVKKHLTIYNISAVMPLQRRLQDVGKRCSSHSWHFACNADKIRQKRGDTRRCSP